LFTPQRLFGEVGSSPDLLAHEPFLERARLQREQERDTSARLALGAYVVARLVDNLLVLGDDEELREGFRWQREAVRRHVDALPVDAPETAHLSGVVTAVPAQATPSPSLWMSLTAYAYFLEHEGRLDEALEMLRLAARSQGSETPVKDFAAYALFAGRLNRQLARWDAATACYSSAEEAALKVGDAVSGLRGRLGKGAVQRGLGNLPLAREVAETVVRDATDLALPDVQALAYADLGAVYALQGLRLEELQANYQAFRLTPDSLQRMWTLGDLGIGLYRIGAYGAARVAFEIVINSDTSFGVRANALLELMDLESSCSNRMAFERYRSVIDQSRQSLSPSAATDYHFKVGTGLARFGQNTRAAVAFKAGLALADTHKLNAWYFKIEQALRALEEQSEQVSSPEQVSEFSEAPEVLEMEIGLREYASTLSA
jgi:tetratricopeptide (TPR) repeat protein